MSAYDKDDLQSVLTYMREKFGMGILEEPSRMYSTMNDLSPNLKSARNILRQLSEEGLCAELSAAMKSGEDNKRSRVLLKIKHWLKDNLDLSDERADYYVTALKVAYGLETQSHPAPAPIPQPKPAPQPPTKPKAPILQLGYTGDCDWTLYGDGALIISGVGNMENYNNNNEAPWPRESVQSVIIEHGVTSIGDYAFWDCSSLTSVGIPDSVTSIGNRAFTNCSSLINVRIPDSVTSIAGGAFSACSSLTSVDVSLANQYYTSIDGILFNKSRTTLLCYPAGKTSNAYMVPRSVTSIGDYAFSNCGSLTNVGIPNSVTSIESGAFFNCRLTSVRIPDSVTSIGKWAFSYCLSLTSVGIPDSVTSIGEGTFFECLFLKSVRIPDSVTSIGDYAFQNCLDLTSVSVPKHTKIDPKAFDEYTTVRRRD